MTRWRDSIASMKSWMRRAAASFPEASLSVIFDPEQSEIQDSEFPVHLHFFANMVIDDQPVDADWIRSSKTLTALLEKGEIRLWDTSSFPTTGIRPDGTSYRPPFNEIVDVYCRNKEIAEALITGLAEEGLRLDHGLAGPISQIRAFDKVRVFPGKRR